ncbi:MAG: response regulator [Candidatus Hodarchaeales archaeon]|jgi:two-component system chemotaxis response regulator CheY
MATVLIVDDSKYLRLMIRKILKKHGHTIVAEAETGVEAIEMYKKHLPNIVTMDVVMPKMNGLMAVKEIITMNPDARVVVVTALGHEPLVRQALKIGAKDFVIKPFKVDQLVSAIEGALA